jgi:hypothetical protein
MCKGVFVGRMQVVLSDPIEKKLREKAFAKYGLKKGSISKAIEEAIKAWVEK